MNKFPASNVAGCGSYLLQYPVAEVTGVWLRALSSRDAPTPTWPADLRFSPVDAWKTPRSRDGPRAAAPLPPPTFYPVFREAICFCRLWFSCANFYDTLNISSNLAFQSSLTSAVSLTTCRSVPRQRRSRVLSLYIERARATLARALLYFVVRDSRPCRVSIVDSYIRSYIAYE